jgi:hypothetical protein
MNLRAVGRKSRRIAFEQRLNDQAAQHADKDIGHLGEIHASAQLTAALRLSEWAPKPSCKLALRGRVHGYDSGMAHSSGHRGLLVLRFKRVGHPSRFQI